MTALRHGQPELPRDAGHGPVWEVATLFPHQGEWTQDAYLRLSASSNRLIEFSDGQLEFLPLPKASHQRILRFLLETFLSFIRPRKLGEMLPSPLRVKLREGRFREPDLVFMLAANLNRAGDDYWDGADLVMEIVSDDGRERDLVEKRSDYAEAGISEYWIVDPLESCIHVLELKDGRYVEIGRHGRGQSATSHLLAGLAVSVDEIFDAAKRKA